MVWVWVANNIIIDKNSRATVEKLPEQQLLLEQKHINHGCEFFNGHGMQSASSNSTMFTKSERTPTSFLLLEPNWNQTGTRIITSADVAV
jgi:hypothetical protein